MLVRPVLLFPLLYTSMPIDRSLSLSLTLQLREGSSYEPAFDAMRPISSQHRP